MKRILLSLLLLVGMATAGLAQMQIVMGDMNRDGEITISDVTSLVNVLLGKSEMQYITRDDFGKPVTGITLDKTSLTLGVGGTATLTATIIPSDAGELGIIWTSSDPSVVSVSSAASSSAGGYEIILESFGSEKLAVIKVVKEMTGLGLAEAKTLVESAPVSLGTYDSATAATHQAALEEAGATVTLNAFGGGTEGEVTALVTGTATITATTVDGGYTATCTVTVSYSDTGNHEYVDMGEGQLWATMNVGATNPEDTGDYFAWGETTAKSSYSWDNYQWGSSDTALTKYVTNNAYGTPDGKNVLEPEDDAATANWGDAWRTPTEDEWNWLRSNCDWTWTDDFNGTGVKGFVATSNITSNSIFLPASGNSDGSEGEYGYGWSSTLFYDNAFAIDMCLYPSTYVFGTEGNYRYLGMPVRPVCSPYQHVAVTGIELNSSSISLEIGQSFIPILNATVLPANASNKNIVWTCSDETVVRFVNTSNTGGYMAGVSPGTATITATTVDGGFTASCEVTVSGVPVTEVTLDKTSLTLAPGETYTLTATVLPEDASIKNVTWSSSNPDDVYVSSEGKVTALALNGFSTITVTAAGGHTATCDVTVRYVPITGITLDKTSLMLKADETATLTVTILPEDATGKVVYWSSSDKSVADITFVDNENGIATITAVGEGTATITAATAGNTFTATCEVMVTTHDYVEMGDGLKWATCNIGAENQWDYGHYFAWGETEPKEDYSWATYKHMLPGQSDWKFINKYQTEDGQTSALWYYEGVFSGDGRTVLEPEDDAATANWGGNWRMPTKAEWDNLRNTNKFVWTWTDDYNGTGVCGYTVSSKVPGYVGNTIFLPAAGRRGGSSLLNAGSYGYYWSSSLNTIYSYYAWGMYFGSSSISTSYYFRSYGQSVRPVCSE